MRQVHEERPLNTGHGSRLRSATAEHSGREPAGRVELGEFGVDVDGNDAEEVEVLRVGRGDVSEDLIGHIASLDAPLPQCQLVVLRSSR
jgi:hypothetical protein